MNNQSLAATAPTAWRGHQSLVMLTITTMFTRIFLLCWLISATLYAQPDWVKGKGTSSRFPQAKYLTGLGIATWHKDSSEAAIARQAYAAAQKDLAEQVRVRIQSASESFKQQAGQEFSSSYQAMVTANSQLEVVGLQKETYHDRKQKLFYTWVYASRPEVIANYQRKLNEANQQLQQRFTQAQRYAESGQKAEAEQQLLQCRTLLTQQAPWRAVLLSLQPTGEPLPPSVALADIENALHQLISEQANSLDDLAYGLVYQLRQSLDEPLQRVVVSPLLYRESEMASSFSYFFRDRLEQEMIRYGSWQTMRLDDVQFNQGNPSMRYTVRGTYEVSGDQLHLSVFVKDVFGQQIISMATARLDVAVVESAQLAYLPVRYEQNAAEQQQMEIYEVADHGIDLEVWTNKGDEALVFTEGERMNVFFRVNMPCHVRFVYHLADGRRVHFFDQYLTADQVGQAQELPYDFICDCTDAPCGIETLQINAQEEPFVPLATQDVGGYRFITEDLSSILQKNRGMKQADAMYRAEQRLVITTMEKPS
ncbi:MAG: LPP20 family lipoprotein [Bacteroidota bacterium]